MLKHNQALGRVLRQQRVKLGLSQQELAMTSGLDRTYISLLELGRKSPTLQTMYALCNAMNVIFPDFARWIDDSLADDRRVQSLR